MRTRALFAAALLALPAAADDPARPIVIAHRGASGARPEHTLEAYKLAIEEGADFIEPDLVATKDGALVARHENEISETTDVASHSEFAGRRTTKSIDGVKLTGWFTEDFTLAELRTLRARERLPQLRGTAFDGRFPVPTLEEILDLVAAMNARLEHGDAERIGIYPETKHPSYFDSIGLSLEEPLVKALHGRGLRGRRAPVWIQSFEVQSLKQLRGLSELPLVQLIADRRDPFDLAEIAKYAQGIGVAKDLVIPRDADGRLLAPTELVRDAHARGLAVHVWTFRAENSFLPAPFRIGGDARELGDLQGELLAFLRQGVDGVFSDHPGIAVAARDRLRKR